MGAQKYVASFLFLLALALTYKWSQSPNDLSLQSRRDIEMTLEDSIRTYIQKQRPEIKQVVFQKLYSEALGESTGSNGQSMASMKVHFRYLTEEGIQNEDETEQVYEGTVTLQSKDKVTWEWIDNTVKSPLIRFKRGSEVRPEGK